MCELGARGSGSPGRSILAEGRGAAAGVSHLKLGGDAMCSPRNGEAAGGDAAPPPRPPLSRSAILPHSPGHPGGARRGGGGGGGGGGGEGGGGAARGRRRGYLAGEGAAGAPAQGRAQFQTAQRSRDWRERHRARPRVPCRGLVRPAPCPASSAPPARALSKVLKSPPRGRRVWPSPALNPTPTPQLSSSSLKALRAHAGSAPRGGPSAWVSNN